MFDRDTVLPIALEALAVCGGGDVADCDRLHRNDTIGPRAACPVRLDVARGAHDEA